MDSRIARNRQKNYRIAKDKQIDTRPGQQEIGRQIVGQEQIDRYIFDKKDILVDSMIGGDRLKNVGQLKIDRQIAGQ